MELVSYEKLPVLLLGEQPMLEQSIPEGLHPFVWFPGWQFPSRQAFSSVSVLGDIFSQPLSH